MYLIFIVITTSVAATSHHPRTIFVNALAQGLNDGSSWHDAYADLQDGLAAANAGAEVWVASSVYYPTQDSNRLAAFRLQSGAAVLGGFTGTEVRRDDRRPAVNLTVLSGDIGVRGVNTDNSYRVVESLDCDERTVLDGFMIRDAYNNCGCPNNRGGGMYNENSRVRIAGCWFVENTAGGGGGVWNQNSQPVFKDCEFERNEGRGMSNSGSVVTLERCAFLKNRSNADGAAIGGFSESELVARNCRFIRNRGRDGSAYYGFGDVTLENCVFFGNHSTNHSTVYFRSGNISITNCAIVANRSNLTVAGLSGEDDAVVLISNTLFWGNVAPRGPLESWQLYYDQGAISHSCVEGWTGKLGGVGNHGLDPQFVDFDGGDYRLIAGSPCIDAGDNEVVGEPFDLDGNPRILSDVVDMGAYESVCDEVQQIATSCKGEPGAGKLVAKLRTSLPGGSTVMLRCNGDGPVAAPIKPNGRGKAKWNNQTGPVEVCPSGCPDSCSAADCP